MKPEDYREDEPCPDGECKHVYDDWPADSVTARDRAFDQCTVCGWTEVDVDKRGAKPEVTAADLTDEEIRALGQSDFRRELHRGTPIHVIAYRALWARTERGKQANRRKCAEIINARRRAP